MSATATHIFAAPTPPPADTRAAWAATTALIKYLDLADRMSREPEGTPMWKAYAEQLEGAKRAAVRACDNFVGCV